MIWVWVIVSLHIVDRPIDYGPERVRLTEAYRARHTADGVASVEFVPRVIVLHFTDGTSADSTWQYFDQVHIGDDRPDLKKQGELNVSSQFLVDRDGTVYRLMPENWMGRHAVGLNHVAIGIENVGDGDRHPLTPAQVDADVALVHYLSVRWPIEVLVGHSESRRLEGTPYFVEQDPKYRDDKDDPGDGFLAAVRARCADLGLRGPPH
jgi:beta-N-acetylhexosaminidase